MIICNFCGTPKEKARNALLIGVGNFPLICISCLNRCKNLISSSKEKIIPFNDEPKGAA